MISRIRGSLLAKDSNRFEIDVCGVAYSVLVPTAVENLLLNKAPGDEVELYTLHYLQLEHTKATPVLIGFVNELQREFFEQLLTVPKLGPKIALSAFSIPMSEVAQALEQGNHAFLKQLPGVGTQKAKDMVAKLQGKVAKYALMKDAPEAKTPATATSSEAAEDALQMLVELGHTTAEAQRMVLAAMAEQETAATADDLIRVIYRMQRH